MTQTCPACAQPASGRFCSHCGVNLEGPATCGECGNPLPPGGRFCNQCGVPAAAPRAAAGPPAGDPAPSRLPWVVAGVAVVALLAAVLVPRLQEEEAPQAPFAATGAPAPAGDARAVDLSSMTPRQAADRLFERVMRLVEGGDTAQARTFLPMALAAYDRVEEVDADARYHLAVLHLFGGDPAAARAQADSILAGTPTHLFGLYTAARAEQDLGNSAAAQALYQQFLDVYDAEVAAARSEYQAHEPAMPGMRQEAARMVDSL